MNNNTNIQEAINQILSLLRKKELSEGSVKSYRYCYCKFQKYLEDNGIFEVNEKICLDYLEIQSKKRLISLWCTVKDPKINRRLRPLHLLLKYLHTGEINLDTRPKTPDFRCPDCFGEAYNEFYYLLSKSELASITQKTILKSIQLFLTFLEEDGLRNIDLLEMVQIDAFILKFKDNKIKYRGTILYGLKKFLVYLFENGFCSQNYTKYLIPLKIPRNGNVPHTWKEEELRKLLKAVDRESPTGKRDYAIFLLAIQTGLRSGDIRNLRLYNIDWNNHKINLIMGKTIQPIELPLLEHVGWAIIDYLKNGRPKSLCDNVFLRHQFPIGPIGSTATLDKRLNAYILKAGIKLKPGEAHGMHTLRSSLARNMLYSGVELPVISQTLGHQHERTTVGNYLKIDLEGLRNCTLDLEWEDENNE